jgi:multiple sugar transport system substrate-binding protein
MKKALHTTTGLLLAAALTMTGCASVVQESSGNQEGEAGNKEEAWVVSNEPVTLKLYVNVVRLPDNEFKAFFVEPLKMKYPNISIELLTGKLEDLIVAGNMPDLIASDNDWHMPLKQLDLPMDLTDLVKKSGLDLSKLNQAAVNAVKNLEPGQLQGIPWSLNQGALFYNKDLFDKFGITYPKDDMLWPDVMELSKKLTRQQDGVQYIGIDLRFPDHMVSPYTQPFVDPKTNKALVDIPLYKKVLELFDQMYKQPGYIGPKDKYAYGPDGFVKDKIQAMQPDWVTKIVSDLIQAEVDGIAPDWDMVTNPTFEDAKGKGRHALADMLVITKASKHKEQAMQVINMMVSREMQILQSRHSRVTILNDDEVKKQFGANTPSLKSKNTAAVFKNPSVPTPPPHIADKEVQTVIRNIRKEMAIGKKDINTVLREGQEKADKKIAELMAK